MKILELGDDQCLGCTECPLPFRISEGHLAIRFGDRRQAYIQVMLDGEDVSNQTTEAVAGDSGWVVFFPEPKHLCPIDRTHPYTVRRHGSVEVDQVSQIA